MLHDELSVETSSTSMSLGTVFRQYTHMHTVVQYVHIA